MIRTIVAAGTLAAAMASPAMATEWIYCGNDDGTATVGLLAGAVEFLSISAVTLQVGEASWASGPSYGDGAPVTVGQAFEDHDMLLIDLYDDNVANLVAQLRVFRAEEGDADVVYGGVLRVPGHGAWVVSCAG